MAGELYKSFQKLPWLARVGAIGAAAWGTSQMFKYLNERDLTTEVVVLTGAGSGIGKSMAFQLAECGCQLALWDIDEKAVGQVVEEIEAMGGIAKCYIVDVCNRTKVYQAAQQVLEDFGQVDILINNAGIVTGKTILECEDHLMEKTVQVNTISHFWTIKAFLPGMLQRKNGHLVTIASMAGLVGVPGLVDYCASKFGAIGTHESIRMELYKLGQSNIKTTLVCPCFIDTGMFTGVTFQRFNPIPVMETSWVAQKIIQAIKRNQERILLPSLCQVAPFTKLLLPDSWGQKVQDLLGMNHVMDKFQQTRNNDTS